MDLIELLRCPQPHEESWLVAAFEELDGRVVVRARLGCPVCSREYPVSAGVLDLRTAARPQALSTGRGAPDIAEPVDPWRLAALLDLRPPATVAVLEGRATDAAEQLLPIYAGALVLLNPPALPDPRERVVTILADDKVPLRSRAVHGVALSTGVLAEDAARVLLPGGRLVAPAAAAIPAGLRVLARDEQEWVAVLDSAGSPVQITRRPHPRPSDGV